MAMAGLDMYEGQPTEDRLRRPSDVVGLQLAIARSVRVFEHKKRQYP